MQNLKKHLLNAKCDSSVFLYEGEEVASLNSTYVAL